jgi:hypothetical protein
MIKSKIIVLTWRKKKTNLDLYRTVTSYQDYDAVGGGMRSGGLEARLRFVFRVNIARVTLVLG